MKLFFDTETTGKADFRSPPDAPHQPRLVQLAALLMADDGKELASMNVIIKPDGYEIPIEASNIHGITTQMAADCGVEMIAATHLFDQMMMRADLFVAHNFNFDFLIMARGSKIRAEKLSARNFCTMLAMTPVCKLPGKYNDYKWPKLQEAFKHAFGKEFDGAHDALADVRACAQVYFWLVKQNDQQSIKI